ncbi:hypothetical protein JCM8202_004521 [Rhodotorula sphaerocarpa]
MYRLCSRVVVVKGQLVGGKPEQAIPPPVSVAELLAENAELRRQVAHLRGEGSSRARPRGRRSALRATSAPAPAEPPGETDLVHARSDLSALGMSTTSVADPRSPVENSCLYPTANLEAAAAAAAAGAPGPGLTDSAVAVRPPAIDSTTIPLELRHLIPPRQLSRFLIDRALGLVGWMHVTVHRPTFLKKHDWWQDERAVDETDCYLGLPWLALYFALLSLGSFFVDDDDAMASVAGLSAGEFPEIGNAFDESPCMATMLACALRMNQDSLSHLLPPEADPAKPGVVTREVPGSPALTMSLLSTSAHCNDEDIQTGTPLPDYARTDLKETSFHHFMYALACQCQTFAGQFVAAAGDAARRVALVAEADRALTELLEQFPLFRSSVEPYPPFDVCVECAHTVIAERRRPKPGLFDRDWRVGFETATAGFHLVAAYKHVQRRTGGAVSDEAETLRTEILDVIRILELDARHNAVARHAVATLQNQFDLAVGLGTMCTVTAATDTLGAGSWNPSVLSADSSSLETAGLAGLVGLGGPDALPAPGNDNDPRSLLAGLSPAFDGPGGHGGGGFDWLAPELDTMPWADARTFWTLGDWPGLDMP